MAATKRSGDAPDLVWLDEHRADDVALVGGKAANLSRLAAVHPVPPGFCVTTSAFAACAVGELGRWNGPTKPMPGAYRAAIAAAYEGLAQKTGQAEPRVAVRSSAVDEDGQSASFAGQHETYLNVVGPGAVVEAVQACWDSLYGERARAYRQRQGLALDGTRLAVLVQHLVAADVSAIVFSANPVSGDRDEIVVNASWGLGESIVGGTVNPDTYLVGKHDLAIRARRLGDKRRMTVAVSGGTREVEVPRLLREQPALADRQIVELARLARRLESATGWPVDVECAFEGDSLYLLQCRRITTLRNGKDD